MIAVNLIVPSAAVDYEVQSNLWLFTVQPTRCVLRASFSFVEASKLLLTAELSDQYKAIQRTTETHSRCYGFSLAAKTCVLFSYLVTHH